MFVHLKEQAAIPNKHKRWKTLMLNAEKEKQKLLELKWGLSVKTKRDDDSQGTNITDRFDSLKDLIRDSKKSSQLTDLERKKAHSATESKGVPSAAEPCNHGNKKPENSSESSINESNIEQTPCTELLVSHGLGWTDTNTDTKNIKSVANDIVYNTKADKSCSELQSIYSDNLEIEAMPNLSNHHNANNAQINSSKKGHKDSQIKVNLPIVTHIALVGNGIAVE